MPDSAITAPAGEPVGIEQRAALRSFLGLSLRNGLLNLVTLTLYRFWGKTIVRRRLWSSIYVNDQPLEYTGRGMELFLGFLIALGLIGLPSLLIVFGVQFLGPGFAAIIIVPLYLSLFVLMGFGRFTAFRYVASRSAWRGVRFRLSGSPFKYGLLFLGYMVLSLVSLGWFWPAADRRLAGRLWGGLAFGDQPFAFDIAEARKEKVYGAYALAWVLGVIGYLFLVGIMMSVLRPATTGRPAEPSAEQIGAVSMISIVVAAGYSIALAPFHAAMLRSVVRGLRFRDLRFTLGVKWHEIAWLTISNLGLLTVTLGALMPFIQARTSKFLLQRLSVTGVVDFDSIGQSTATVPRTGEGLADAFGMATI